MLLKAQYPEGISLESFETFFEFKVNNPENYQNLLKNFLVFTKIHSKFPIKITEGTYHNYFGKWKNSDSSLKDLLEKLFKETSMPEGGIDGTLAIYSLLEAHFKTLSVRIENDHTYYVTPDYDPSKLNLENSLAYNFQEMQTGLENSAKIFENQNNSFDE